MARSTYIPENLTIQQIDFILELDDYELDIYMLNELKNSSEAVRVSNSSSSISANRQKTIEVNIKLISLSLGNYKSKYKAIYASPN